MVMSHYEAMLSFYGTHLGTRCARKHLGWYMDTVATAPELRRQILTSVSPDDVFDALPDALMSGEVLAFPRHVA